MPELKHKPITFTGRGVTSRRDITVTITPQSPNHGIVFELPLPEGDGVSRVPARADFVVNTLRNVTLGSKVTRICIVEHILCAVSLWGYDDLLIRVEGPELPLADGSAKMWIDLFKEAGWERKPVAAQKELPAPVICKKGDRVLMAVPDETFSATYMMDWDHPAIGRRWFTWTPEQPIEALTDCRTFGTMEEHKLLGITDQVSLTADGFSEALRYPDEPVRHKILDLIGDLALAGVNPLSWKARFISIKGGHELDVQLAKALSSR
jgi:UDP-3-O-acyl N-acetylglucosamine deacetylase